MQFKSKFTVVVIVGSLRKESYNRKLMRALDKLIHTKIAFTILNLNDIPLFNQDHENNLPTSVVSLKEQISNADGVLFVTPEYNRSIPGVLKNVIDWGTRPAGKNVWKDKPTAIVGISPGSIATAVAQSHLRSIMTAVGAIVLGQPEIYLVYKEGLIDDTDQITDEGTKKFLELFLDKFQTFLELVTPRSD